MTDTMMSREIQEREPFIDRMWLLQRGPLRRETVLEYFGLSRFYDRQSNNEELRMQGHMDVRLEQLKDLKGVQFLAEQVPGVTPDQPIFVIWKIFRSSPRKTQVLEVYYVLNGFIYQAPTIISVLNAKLRRCAYMLNNAQTMLSQCIDFEMGQGQSHAFRRPEEDGGEREEAPTAHHHQQPTSGHVSQYPASAPPLESPASVERIIMSLVDDYLPKNENGESAKMSVYPGSTLPEGGGGGAAAPQGEAAATTR